MTNSPYGRVIVLARKLEEQHVPADLIDQIMEGGMSITAASSNEAKADWFRQSMLRMDKLLDRDTRHAVRESCACCLGGKRLKLMKEVSKAGGSLEERVARANEARLVFGQGVTLEPDGRLLVRFGPDDSTANRCVCLPGANGHEPISITYCYCCGGHIKHHLQTALDRKLELKVRTSALSSGGKKTCSFWFTIVD